MRVQLLVAVAENGVIGFENDLIWHLPNDLKRFKRLTKGHPVIMGRKTFEAIGKPLPGRLNIILSRKLNADHQNCMIANTKESALHIAKQNSGLATIIGGESIYKEFEDVVELIHLTRVECSPNGDAHYSLPKKDQWECFYKERHKSDARHAYNFSFESHVRR